MTGQKQRKDVVRNNRAILQAAGQMIKDDPASLDIASVAKQAGLAASTVYRYYPSAEALLSQYMREVNAQIRDFSHACEATGSRLFDEVLAEWGRIISVFGPGLVQIRSRRGFLDRLDTGDPAIENVRSAWDRPIHVLLRSLGVDDGYYENALFLFNQMFDPREMLDLTRRGMTMEQAVAMLKVAYLTGIQGLQEAGAQPIPGAGGT